MTRSSLGARWVGALATAGAALLFQSGAARAQYSQCADDADCGPGFVCNTGTYESCSGGWECDDEGNCTELPSDCETFEHSWCANANCETNADCPSFMLCQPQTNWICEGGMAGTGAGGASGIGGASGFGGVGGAAGMGCSPDGCPEPVCHEEPAPSVCIQRYQLPCEQASDCGAGFDCVESYYWECSGGGAGGAAGMAVAGVGGVGGTAGVAGGDGDGDGDGDGEPFECHEVPSGVSYCSLQNLPCESDAECFEGLACSESYDYPPCVFVPGEGGEGGTAGGVAGTGSAGIGGSAGTAMGGFGGDGDGGYWECPPPVVSHRCQPIGQGGGGTGGMGGAGGYPGGAGGMTGGDGDGDGDGPGNAGTGAGAGGNTGSPDDDGENDEHGHGHGHGKAKGVKKLLKKLLGCSAGGPIEGNASMGWLMLGLAAVVLRRRTRRS